MVKVGRTSQEQHRCIVRLRSYPKNSKIVAIYSVPCAQVNTLEAQILSAFKERYKLAYGREYFVGDEASMEFDMWRFMGPVYEYKINSTATFAPVEEVHDEKSGEPIESANDLIVPVGPRAVRRMPESVFAIHNTHKFTASRADYVCPRCGHFTRQKHNMADHFNLQCEPIVNNVDLNDEVKKYVLLYKRYLIKPNIVALEPAPLPVKRLPIANMITSFVNNRDIDDTVFLILKRQLKCVNFDEHIASLYDGMSYDLVNTPMIKYLEEDDFIRMLSVITKSRIHDKQEISILYDNNMLYIYMNNTWLKFCIKSGIVVIVETLIRKYLFSYDKYLIRMIEQSTDNEFKFAKGGLNEYYNFISSILRGFDGRYDRESEFLVFDSRCDINNYDVMNPVKYINIMYTKILRKKRTKAFAEIAVANSAKENVKSLEQYIANLDSTPVANIIST